MCLCFAVLIDFVWVDLVVGLVVGGVGLCGGFDCALNLLV